MQYILQTLTGVEDRLAKVEQEMQNQLLSQLNMIMGKLSEGSQTEADLQASKKEIANSELLDLLKKTQMQVSSLENEIQRVEAENIHQERLHKKTDFQYLHDLLFSL